MNWSKAKVILIAIFLITDIFLAVKTYNAGQGMRISADIIANTKKILSNNNINIQCDIPTKINKLSWMIFQYEDTDKKAIARRFLGTDSVEWLPVNNGEQARFGTTTLLISEDETIIFSEINPQIVGKGMSLSKAEKSIRTHIKKYFPRISRYIVDKKFIDSFGNYNFTFIELYNNGYGIFDNYIKVSVGADGTITTESFYIKALGTTHEGKEILNINEILLAGFMNDMKECGNAVTISDIKLGYLAITGGKNLLHSDMLSGNIQSSPSWRITTSDENEYFYNAYNGRKHIRN